MVEYKFTYKLSGVVEKYFYLNANNDEDAKVQLTREVEMLNPEYYKIEKITTETMNCQVTFCILIANQ